MPHPAADSFERVRAALADRYAVERELGSGGMAVVYLARDRKHDRPVVLKILRPEIAAVLDRALASDSTYPPAHLFHAWYYLARNRTDSALGEFRAAVRLDPVSLVNNARLTTGLWLARRYDAAVVQATRTEELNPQFFQAHIEAGRAL
jgi:hypothetical protein